jgi:cyclophilin family peptidyl-prolyl cis-trans isomerase
MAASSFFITLNDPHDRHLDYLDVQHAPFAMVVEDESGVLCKLDGAVVDARKAPVCNSAIF